MPDAGYSTPIMVLAEQVYAAPKDRRCKTHDAESVGTCGSGVEHCWIVCYGVSSDGCEMVSVVILGISDE